MTRARYNPIKLRGPGPSASEIIIADRYHDRFSVAERREAAQQPQQEKSSDGEKNLSRKTSAKSHVNPPNTLTR